MMAATIAFFIIVVPSIAGSISLMVAGSTTALVPPTIPVQEHRLTQTDIDIIIDVEAPLYGLDPKLVKRISFCEDQGNPYAKGYNRTTDGSVWSTDKGPLQVNDLYHEAEMKAQGKDINNPIDSLMFGLGMMKREGTRPWNWSKHCWWR